MFKVPTFRVQTFKVWTFGVWMFDVRTFVVRTFGFLTFGRSRFGRLGFGRSGFRPRMSEAPNFQNQMLGVERGADAYNRTKPIIPLSLKNNFLLNTSGKSPGDTLVAEELSVGRMTGGVGGVGPGWVDG